MIPDADATVIPSGVAPWSGVDGISVVRWKA